MTSRFTELPNNGWKLTNELGYILQDRALSVVQARKVVSCSDCLCPTKQLTCLRVPCNLSGSKCQFVTLPLFDAATRAPFQIGAGTLIDSIIVMRRPGACLDPELQFMLGTIAGNDCDSECDPQRWASESCPVSGAQLNKCGVIKVDAAKKLKECPLFLCRTGACPGQCGTGFAAQESPCDGPGGPAEFQEPSFDGCEKDDDGCYCVTEGCDGCSKYCGPCSFAGESLAGALIGITLLCGSLAQDDIIISVETWAQCCDTLCDQPDDCAGVPAFGFGNNAQF